MNMNCKISRLDARRCRVAFTVIELLMVISILAILGGLALSLIGGARYDANAARTETQIRRIKTFIQARLEDYAVRMLPFRPQSPNKQWARNRILIEFVRSEMPCRLDHLTIPSAHFTQHFNDTTPTPPPPPIHFSPLDVVTMMSDVPALHSRMVRELTGGLLGDVADLADDGVIQDQAECLYEILNSHNDYDSSGMDFIFRGEIGDTDNDNHLEILDAWGDPLLFSLHMHGHEGSTLDDYDDEGTPTDATDDAMNIEGPLAVHIDVTSVNIPQ